MSIVECPHCSFRSFGFNTLDWELHMRKHESGELAITKKQEKELMIDEVKGLREKVCRQEKVITWLSDQLAITRAQRDSKTWPDNYDERHLFHIEHLKNELKSRLESAE